MLEFSPDFYELNGGAKVEQMRMIRQELSKKAFGGNNRVVVITDAHMMNDSAVNAMLKMLEEPPGAQTATMSPPQRVSIVVPFALTMRSNTIVPTG